MARGPYRFSTWAMGSLNRGDHDSHRGRSHCRLIDVPLVRRRWLASRAGQESRGARGIAFRCAVSHARRRGPSYTGPLIIVASCPLLGALRRGSGDSPLDLPHSVPLAPPDSVVVTIIYRPREGRGFEFSHVPVAGGPGPRDPPTVCRGPGRLRSVKTPARAPVRASMPDRMRRRVLGVPDSRPEDLCHLTTAARLLERRTTGASSTRLGGPGGCVGYRGAHRLSRSGSGPGRISSSPGTPPGVSGASSTLLRPVPRTPVATSFVHDGCLGASGPPGNSWPWGVRVGRPSERRSVTPAPLGASVHVTGDSYCPPSGLPHPHCARLSVVPGRTGTGRQSRGFALHGTCEDPGPPSPQRGPAVHQPPSSVPYTRYVPRPRQPPLV